MFVDNKTESSVIGAGIIEFADDKHAFMINGLNEIWESSDAGNTWVKYDIEWEGEISKNGTRAIDYKVLDKNKIILIGTHYLFIYDNSTSSIKNNSLITNVNVFPNPSQNFLNISFQSQIEQITKVEIYNINGERKYVSNNINNLNQIKINVQDFDKGSYFFKLYSINDELVSFGKFVKN